ncbi:MAG: hypothetical protein ABI742_02785 [Gemmatimonadota bacterium]
MLPLALALLLGAPSPTDSLCPAFPPSGPTTYRSIDSLLSEVRRASFPDLAGEDIVLNELRSATDFFTSGTELRTFLNARRQRAYLVYVNPRLFKNPPPRAAIRAVLAHELSHIVDYNRRSAPGLARFTFHYLTSNEASYERATDLATLGRGYGCGLIAYREWLYRRVSPTSAAVKRRFYLTPEEIRVWLTTGSLPPAAPAGPG